MRKHFTLIFVTVFILFGWMAVHGKAQALELKFGHVGAPGSLFQICADEFAKRANAKLGSKAKVVTFGSSQLGKDRELLRKLKLGTVHFALPSTVMSSVADEFGLFEMPYLVKDRNHMRRIRDEIFWAKLEPALEKKGYKVIGVWENGFRHITNNVRPIYVPADLKGLKLRTPKGAWRVKMFKAYGANPTPMAFSEVFVALQTGVIDGQENPFAQIYSAKFHEVQKYLSLTGHVYTPAYVTVGLKQYAKLPADVREILEETAQGMQEFVYETAEKLEKELLEKMRGSLEINTADKQAFIKASAAIYKEFGSSVPGGAELIEQARKLAK
ncbi:MAG: TRAP transporter substrate-binding protein [Deltaproteobacteria bacterium]|nr:TRAP transporter substrate-binding protein [Deltaproteobacteria bacterium]MBW1962927.1 TRAP transporter substrate-binding protein [Deltaproteobacteria bacterium]MBW1995631.1 TRAP transporter substrate-binding protein [Deltaproteobacteria bacterium]MBW2153650.1 TRAP transporter substrate-binding protein [Deltaproteobacteria bacterium]